MDYNVDIVVAGYFSWHGKAPNKELAKEFALQAANEADFGALEDIVYEVDTVEIDK